MPQSPGLLIGRGDKGDFVYRGEAHLATFAGTGGGKTASSVMTNALRWPGSLIVIDPKGEVANRTAPWRAGLIEGGLDQQVFILDPFTVCDPDLARFRAAFNPIETIPAGPGDSAPEAVRHAKRLADSFVFKARGDNRYFSNQAVNLLKGAILHVATREGLAGERHLATVADMLADIDELLDDMTDNHGADGIVRRVGRQMSGKPERERGSIVSTAQESLEILDDRAIATSLSHTSEGLDFAALKRRPATIYFVLPFEYLELYSRWLRLLVAHAIDALSGMEDRADPPVLFILDEFANLHEMDIIKNAFSYMRGAGVILWILLQELSVLKRLYRDWEAMLANCGIIEGFAINSLTTSEYLSKLSGTRIVERETRSSSVSAGRGGASASQNTGVTIRDEPWLQPHDIRWQARRHKLVFPKTPAEPGQPAHVTVDQVRWFEDETFRARVPDKYR